MAMFQRTADDGAQPLLVGTPSKLVRFRQLVLSIRFVLSLRRTSSPPPPSPSPPPPQYTVIDVHFEDERDIQKQRLKKIVKEKNLKALKDFGGVEEAVSFLRSESLLQIDAQTLRGYGFCGSFLLFVKEFCCYLWNSLNSWTILFLVIAAGLSFAIESLEQGLKHGWHDGFGILLAVFLLVFFPPILSVYRKRADEKELLKNKNILEVTVKRDELCQRVSVSDVREGDRIHLNKGDRVPADGLLIKGKNLILDEVINSHIDPNRNPFLFCGSVVEHGEGEMIAVSVGHDTAFGKVLLELVTHPSQETLFQSRMNKPYEFLEKFSLTVSLTILVVVLARLLCKHHDDYYNDRPETKGKLTAGIVVQAFERMFLKFGSRASFLATVLLTMVIGLQHGMPFAITLSLSFWREKMRSLKGNCLNLSACGTLGLVSAICIDITAELSFHEVELCEFFVAEQKINSDMEFHTDISQSLELAAQILYSDPKVSVHLGNDLVHFLKNKLGAPDQKFDIIDHKFLSSEKGIGALVSKRSEMDTEANLFHVHYYGDASSIVSMCSQYYDIRGIVHDIENEKDVFENVIREMKQRGLRPIAFACKQRRNDDQLFEGESKLLGFIGLKFSHEKTLNALWDLQNIGARIILISEDELFEAINMVNGLGTQCDLKNNVVEGERFKEIMMTDGTERHELMKNISFMGKATSEDKHLLIKELKAEGNIVAFSPDLTSRDVPTLMEADIRILQEHRSSKESRMVGDIMCEDVTSLNQTLKSSRCIYLNIQKFYQIQFIASVSGLVITLVCTMVSGKSPIATLQLIWVTLIMCLLGVLMMVMELNDEEVQAPLQGRDRNQSLITRVILYKIVIHVLCQVFVFLLFEYLGPEIMPHMEENVRHTMIFNTFVLCQIANLLAAMGLVTNSGAFFKAALQSPWFLVFLASVLTVQMVVIEFASGVVNGVKLSAVQWSCCFFFAWLLLIVQ
ncbi:Calcium-transporting ATPase 12, plasma membrane-type, partial [Cucurbita argyrosperma subsp. argyrosperma]